ncbi:MAG TPA: DUF6541 family protein [Micromonosporaceae bacterium]|nr:DUF6541 family protein [Micromonosporaceae bacterium]
MTWLDAAPVALTGAAWLFLPGLLIAGLLGLRGIAAWSTAPLLSLAVILTTAVLSTALGIAWSAYLPPAVALVGSAFAALLAAVLRRWLRADPVTDPPAVTAAAALGMLPVLVLGTLTVVLGFRHPAALSQTFDAVFHYSAIAHILDSRDASPLTVGSLGNAVLPPSFYPATWHDVASLVVMATGTTIPVAANVVAGATAVLVWPAACVLLVRQIVGRSVAAMAITGVLSIAFASFPWGLLWFGVLWPNALGLSLVPIALAILLSITGLAEDDVIGRARAWILWPVALGTVAVTHPNALFSLGAVAAFLVGAGVLRRARRLRRVRRANRAAAEMAGFLATCGLLWWWAATTPVFAGVRQFYWAPFETPAQAIGEVLLHAPNHRSPLWALSAVVLVGSVAAWMVPRRRWLVAGFVLAGALYTMTASVNEPSTQKFTGYWYNDSYRLAAMLPIVTVPVAVCGVLLIAGWVQTGLRRRRFAAEPGTEAAAATGAAASHRRVGLSVVGSGTGVTVALTLLLMLCTGAFHLDQHAAMVASTYTIEADPDADVLVDPGERQFLTRIRDEVPRGAVIANNPWDGSALVWALAGRKPLFPHLFLVTSRQQAYLADHLVNAASDPEVCRAADQLGVRYLMVGRLQFWRGDRRIRHYPGIVDPGDRRGFELVASQDDMKLYRITACVD